MVRFEPDAMFGIQYHGAPDEMLMVLKLYNALIYMEYIGKMRGILSMVFLSGGPIRPC